MRANAGITPIRPAIDHICRARSSIGQAPRKGRPDASWSSNLSDRRDERRDEIAAGITQDSALRSATCALALTGVRANVTKPCLRRLLRVEGDQRPSNHLP